MIKSLLRLSRPCMWGPCTVTLSESAPKQCRSSMNSSQNSASPRSIISASSSSRGKYQSPTKLQDLATGTTNESTPIQYTVLILMAAGRQKIGRKLLHHSRKIETPEPLIKDSISTAKEAAQPTVATIVAEACTQSNPRTACIMVANLTSTPKTALFS
jgi:precorrin-4 methylase